MNRLFSPNVDAVDHPDGHVLVVGDVAVMPAADAAVIPAAAAQVALLLKSFGQRCSLIGFVGGDDTGAILQNQLRNSGVSLDVLPVTDWSSYTVGPELDPDQPEQQRVLPFNGMSEYQAHLQNRVERAVRNACALVIVDQGFGSMGDPRAAVFAAQQMNIPSLALCAASLHQGYVKATRVIPVGPQIEAGLLRQQLDHLQSIDDDSNLGQFTR